MGVEAAMGVIRVVDDGRLKRGHAGDGGRVRVSQLFLITLFVYLSLGYAPLSVLSPTIEAGP